MAFKRFVTIEQLPEIATEDHGRRILGMIQNRMGEKRPGLVLDCSGLSQLDKPTLHLLLSCLEAAMKRNGDAKLAAVSPSAQGTLKSIGADRLFQIFPSSADAVNSFNQHYAGMNTIEYPNGDDGRISENAA